jgi:hypothetical protein
LFADTIWKDLLKMQSTGGSGGGDSNKDSYIVSTAKDILGKLPE